MSEKGSPLRFFNEEDSGVVALFSRRVDGNMKDGFKKEENGRGKINREYFLDQFVRPEFPEMKVILAKVVHQNNVEIVTSESPDVIEHTDGLVTQEKNVAIAVTGADCPPIIFLGKGKKGRVVGIAHGGYNSILSNILKNTIGAMMELGVNKLDIQAVIGPGICEDCYEFGPEAQQKFERYEKFISSSETEGKFMVNLKGVIFCQLVGEIGIPMDSVYMPRFCTKCGDKNLFSYREDKKTPVEAGMALIGIT